MPTKTRVPLPANDPRYLRRLVRTLNNQANEVYLNAKVVGTEINPRLRGRVRYSESDGKIHVPASVGDGEEQTFQLTADQAGEAFAEATGQTIYADRAER